MKTLNHIDYIGKMYRIRISDDKIDNLICLPSPNDNHFEIEIPKNSIVKIIDFHIIQNANFFEILYNKKKYLVPESQIEHCFIQIHVRDNGSK